MHTRLRSYLLLGGFSIMAALAAKSDLERLLDKAKKELKGVVEKNQGGALTNNEIIGGLKEALKVGARAAGSRGSIADGFFRNLQIRIPMPRELQHVEKFLNRMGLKRLTADFVESMNRGAEAAARLAVPIFVRSISKMTFQDARSILSGQENAATEFLRRTSKPEMQTAFLPVIDRSLKKVDATRYWEDIRRTYNSVNVFSPIKTDLNTYVTDKALDGLFVLMADEERKIRRDPMGQASALIRKVFGSGTH